MAVQILSVNPNWQPVELPDGTLCDDLEVAQSYDESLILEIKEIESQLGDERRKDPETGLWLDAEAYAHWRHRARKALLHKQRLHVRLKQFIRSRKQEKHSARLLLQDAYSILRSFTSLDENEDRDIKEWLERAENLMRAGG